MTAKHEHREQPVGYLALLFRRDEEGGILPRWREASRDGPAVIWRSADGRTSERYFLDGVEYQKDEHDAKTNALLTGLRLPPANGGQDTIETLLREASAVQSAPHTLAAGRPLSLSLRSSAPGAQPGGSGREYIPLPQL